MQFTISKVPQRTIMDTQKSTFISMNFDFDSVVEFSRAFCQSDATGYVDCMCCEIGEKDDKCEFF